MNEYYYEVISEFVVETTSQFIEMDAGASIDEIMATWYSTLFAYVAISFSQRSMTLFDDNSSCNDECSLLFPPYKFRPVIDLEKTKSNKIHSFIKSLATSGLMKDTVTSNNDFILYFRSFKYDNFLNTIDHSSKHPGMTNIYSCIFRTLATRVFTKDVVREYLLDKVTELITYNSRIDSESCVVKTLRKEMKRDVYVQVLIDRIRFVINSLNEAC